MIKQQFWLNDRAIPTGLQIFFSFYLPHPQTQTRNNHVRIIRRTSARRRPREVALEPSPALINGAPDFKLRTSERNADKASSQRQPRRFAPISLLAARKRRPEICRPGHTKKSTQRN
jgi:hypothetical protein